MEKDYDWYDQDVENLCKAMLKAKEAFNDYFDEQSLDGAYWKLQLTGFVLADDMNTPLDKVVMDSDPLEDEQMTESVKD